MEEIKKGIYKHYKGNFYKVLGTAIHSETLEKMVIYMALYEGKFGKNAVFIRPIKMFFEDVEIDGKKIPRFEWVKESEEANKELQ